MAPQPSLSVFGIHVRVVHVVASLAVLLYLSGAAEAITSLEGTGRRLTGYEMTDSNLNTVVYQWTLDPVSVEATYGDIARLGTHLV